jgi:hypothetical protein
MKEKKPPSRVTPDPLPDVKQRQRSRDRSASRGSGMTERTERQDRETELER